MQYEDITKEIIAACFQVSNELGVGFLESVYEKALMVVLSEKGIKAKNQVPLKVGFHGQIIGEFFADMVVEDRILVELKEVKALAVEHQAQTLNYLRASGLPVALLVNFGKSKLEYRRFNNKLLLSPSSLLMLFVFYKDLNF